MAVCFRRSGGRPSYGKTVWSNVCVIAYCGRYVCPLMALYRGARSAVWLIAVAVAVAVV